MEPTFEPILSTQTSVGFTGHRRLRSPEVVRDGISAAVDRLAASHSNLVGVCSIASGADTLFVEELARRSIPFFILLPFAVEEFRRDFDEGDWCRVEPLLEQAIAVEITTDTGTRAQRFMECGVVTVDRADVMLAVWDGQPPRGEAGTAPVVAYARSVQKPLLLIDPETGALQVEWLEDERKGSR
jgi:hypothetical protein